ncbi:MAG: 30S ribosomal protein S21 [Candidatus Buchananbacteria bacterium]
MSEIKRKRNESFESMLRRFNKKVIHSGRLIQAKKVRFHERPKNKRAKRSAAARRSQIVSKMEYLRKIGRLPEETSYRGKKR